MNTKPEVEALVDQWFELWPAFQEFIKENPIFCVKPEAQEAFSKMCSSGMFDGAGDEDDRPTND